jgi:hypothetical protein
MALKGYDQGGVFNVVHCPFEEKCSNVSLRIYILVLIINILVIFTRFHSATNLATQISLA